MGKIDNTKEQIEKQALGYLSGKPIWIWWLSYTILLGILFGLFYLIWTMLIHKWWVIALAIVGGGLIWATIAYFNQKPKPSNKQSGE